MHFLLLLHHLLKEFQAEKKVDLLTPRIEVVANRVGYEDKIGSIITGTRAISMKEGDYIWHD